MRDRMPVGLVAFFMSSMLASPMPGGGAVATAAAIDTRVAETLAHATSRCTQLSELVSCDAALSMKPNDPDLLMAEADVLIQLKRPGEAIGVYRNALRAGAREEAIKQKIAQAASQRLTMLQVCMSESGDAGVRACESTWLPGAPDEVAMFKRRGFLLHEDNPTAALDAYMSAARLAPRDPTVARAVVALSGSLDAKGASILTARGAALMTLHRPQQAIAPLRQAVQLAPDLSEAHALLRAAEQAQAKKADAAADVGASGPVAPTVEASLGAGASKSYSNAMPVTRTQ